MVYKFTLGMKHPVDHFSCDLPELCLYYYTPNQLTGFRRRPSAYRTRRPSCSPRSCSRSGDLLRKHQGCQIYTQISYQGSQLTIPWYGGCGGVARCAVLFDGWLDLGFPESVEVELLESEGLELLASSSHSLNRTLHWLCAADATA